VPRAVIWRNMKYSNVYVEGLAYALPQEVITSEELEARLAPLYARLRLPEGRLELMTGIRERRFWPQGMLPSEQSIVSANRLFETTGFDRNQVGALIHASVCRDYLEPATACGVHRALGLPAECLVYDVSNACLGILNGMVQVANLIELGQIQAGLVVGTESARPLVENTIRTLNADASLTREQMKLAVASLTIGSGSAAVLLTHKSLSRSGKRLLAATAYAHSLGHELCRGQEQQLAGAEASGGMVAPLMQTDSEQLLEQGVIAAQAAFQSFLKETGWPRDAISKTICHQVGSAHRKLLLKTLGLDAERDFTTYETLGNTGSVALPITLAKAMEAGHLQRGDRVALLGIGSGINVLMLALEN
jgi:3-oxoacyl-[acyl-carrier-protein] synthase III